MTEKYHKAARDGNVSILSQGSRRDMNCTDEDGMSPVHWAAFSGQLEALRIITGRGGDINKADVWGHTCLHYAARKSNMTCVTYLVNFGANLWALDNDGQSALDYAAMNGHQEIVRYLDAEMAKMALRNPKEVEKKKKKALSDAEKRSKKWLKFASEEGKSVEISKQANICRDLGVSINPNGNDIALMPPGKKTTLRNLEHKFKQTMRISTSKSPGSDRNLSEINQKRSFSDYVMTTSSQGSRSTSGSGVTLAFNKLTHRPNKTATVRTCSSDVIYACDIKESTIDSGISIGKSPEPPSLFERPGFGSVAFRAFNQVSSTLSSFESTKDTWSSGSTESSSSSSNHNHMHHPWKHEQHNALDPEMISPLETFLNSVGLADLLPIFMSEQISLESLNLLTNEDLNELNIGMGPRRLLLDALKRREMALQQPQHLYDVRF